MDKEAINNNLKPHLRKATAAEKRRAHNIRKIKEWGTFTAYLTPSFVGVLVFFFVPLLMLWDTSLEALPVAAVGASPFSGLLFMIGLFGFATCL